MEFLLSAAGGGGLGAALAAKGIAASGQNVSVMAQAIEQRGGEPFVAEDLDPLGERQVGGDDGGAALITLGQEVEQQLAAGALGTARSPVHRQSEARLSDSADGAW